MTWFKRKPSPASNTAEPFNAKDWQVMSEVSSPPDGPVIADGVSYTVPPVVPGYVKRDPGSIQQYLEHTLPQSAYDRANPERTYRFQFDGNRSAYYTGRVNMPIDDPLCEWDADTREDVLTNCHAAYHRNPIAKAAVDLTRRFVVGKGHTVTAKHPDVQAVIDAFRDNPDNDIYGYDRTFIQDLQIDGELFIRLFSEQGQTIITQNPPWYFKGATTEAGFMRRVITWRYEYAQNGEQVREDVPSEDMIHVAINRHGYELRGRPDLFAILPWLRAYNEWIVDRARQNKWRGALLWVVKVANTAAGMLSKARQAWRKPPTPGSVAVVPDTWDVQAVNNPVGANDASEDGRQIKLMSAVGVGVPEYMLSDGENANLASATAQQLPALWKFIDGQQLMAEQVWAPIYRRVIQAAIDAGDLPAEIQPQDSQGNNIEGEDAMPTIQAFEVTYYELQGDDPATLADALGKLVDRQVMSLQTARERYGLDQAEEMERLKKEKEERRDEMAQGTNYVQQPSPGEMGDDTPESDSSDAQDR